jgi:Nucleosome binding factor SPN, SPT16 subunit
MECEQLIRLIKDWYLRVKQETMAPARMMQFVDQHVKNCRICQADLLLPDEVEKIREFVLRESKIPKASRSLDDTTPEISPGEEDDFDEDDEYVDDTDDELDEDDIDDDEEDDLSDDDVI